MSKLYIVATPIGNLEDITLRALRVLREVDVIACEDTRHTNMLLSHYDIKKRLIVVVDYIRENSEHEIVPVPGASAFTTLVSASGRVGKAFTFEGFLSPKSGRRKKRLSELISRNEAFIIYESPFRVVKTLKEAKEIEPGLVCVMGREMTKQFEEIKKMDIDSLISYLEAKSTIKGEFAILMYKAGVDDKAEED